MCAVDNGLGMDVDNFHCILGGRIVVMLILVFKIIKCIIIYELSMRHQVCVIL